MPLLIEPGPAFIMKGIFLANRAVTLPGVPGDRLDDRYGLYDDDEALGSPDDDHNGLDDDDGALDSLDDDHEASEGLGKGEDGLEGLNDNTRKVWTMTRTNRWS